LPNTEELTSENIEKEAFALSPVEGETEGLFLATGSEV
jgi:transketolase